MRKKTFAGQLEVLDCGSGSGERSVTVSRNRLGSIGGHPKEAEPPLRDRTLIEAKWVQLQTGGPPRASNLYPLRLLELAAACCYMFSVLDNFLFAPRWSGSSVNSLSGKASKLLKNQHYERSIGKFFRQ